MLLEIYRYTLWALSPFIRLYLWFRLHKGKEEQTRFHERLGKPSIARPAGRLIWLHAASVGEALSIILLVKTLRNDYPANTFLVTTGTVSSAQLMKERLPAGVLHHYIPVDIPQAVKRFLAHWQPQLALWVESELWPLLVTETAKYCPMILLNARLSEQSYHFWQRYPSLAKRILQSFSCCIAQTSIDAERLTTLGIPTINYIGNIKYAALPLPVEETQLATLQQQCQGRLIWVAASTHAGEEEILLNVYQQVKSQLPELLLVIAPRHKERGNTIAELVRNAQLHGSLRSQAAPILPETDIYIADTLGELGLFYRLSSVVFMGGSLIPHGGQNPLEAARLECALLMGPYHFNFSEIVERLQTHQALTVCTTATALAEEIIRLFTDKKVMVARAEAAKQVAENAFHVLSEVIYYLKPYL